MRFTYFDYFYARKRGSYVKNGDEKELLTF